MSNLSGNFHNLFIFECDKETCKCGGKCKHRMTPEKFNLKVELFKTKHAGYAVKSAQFIQYGNYF